jgi:hypothetical protein
MFGIYSSTLDFRVISHNRVITATWGLRAVGVFKT